MYTATTYVLALVEEIAGHGKDTSRGDDWWSGSTRNCFEWIWVPPSGRSLASNVASGSVAASNVTVIVAGPPNGEKNSGRAVREVDRHAVSGRCGKRAQQSHRERERRQGDEDPETHLGIIGIPGGDIQ